MDRRILTILFSLWCLIVLPSSVAGQTGTLIVKTSIDECSKTKLILSLHRITPLPRKVIFELKDSSKQDAKPIISRELTQQTDEKYYWSGIISFRGYVAEFYSVNKKTLLGRYSFNTESAAGKFITDRLSEIIQLRQGDTVGSNQEDTQIVRVTGISIHSRSSLMEILIMTKKGGIVAQYLGPPVNNWNSSEKVPVGFYKQIILQFDANGCRIK